jgi:hypothetical protein
MWYHGCGNIHVFYTHMYMDTQLEELKTHLQEYLVHMMYGTDTAFCLSHIFLCILILQYQCKKEPISILDYITSIIPALYLTDLLSGLIHLFIDTHKGGINNILDELSVNFQRHHKNPATVIDESMYEHLLESSPSFVPLSFVIFNGLYNTPKKYILMQIVTLYGLHLSHTLHVMAHYMNHATQADKDAIYGHMLTFLQENHIIISPLEHKAHHIAPKHDTNFCLFNGWANTLLNAIVGIPCIHSKLFD